MILYGEDLYRKIVPLDDIYNFVVEHFIIKIRFGAQKVAIRSRSSFLEMKFITTFWASKRTQMCSTKKL